MALYILSNCADVPLRIHSLTYQC